MISPPRNRRRTPTSPRRQLVLKLNQIRCVECDGSANCAYLRPFSTYWTPDGWVTRCRIHGPNPDRKPEKLGEAPVATTPPTPSSEVSQRAA